MRIKKSANGWTIYSGEQPVIEVLTFIEAWAACWEVSFEAALRGIHVGVSL